MTVPQLLAHPWLKDADDEDADEEEEDSKDDKPNDGKGHIAGGLGGEEKTEIDVKTIQGNVNYVNVDNLFYDENYGTKLSYTDYCCITEDFSTQHLSKLASIYMS